MAHHVLTYTCLAIVAGLLFLAAAPLPYGFYTFLKIIVTLTAGYMACRGYQARQAGFWPWAWAIVAIVFNPVVQVTMTRNVWITVDIVTGALFGLAAYRAYRHQRES